MEYLVGNFARADGLFDVDPDNGAIRSRPLPVYGLRMEAVSWSLQV